MAQASPSHVERDSEEEGVPLLQLLLDGEEDARDDVDDGGGGNSLWKNTKNPALPTVRLVVWCGFRLFENQDLPAKCNKLSRIKLENKQK